MARCLAIHSAPCTYSDCTINSDDVVARGSSTPGTTPRSTLTWLSVVTMPGLK
jgi:hypothetical protein